MQLTSQQNDFISAVTSTDDNLVLRARAGCGKTSTILVAVDAIVENEPAAEIAVCAYNNPIAKEISGKLKARGHTDWRTVNAATVHSMGFGLVKFAFRLTQDDVNKHKVRDILRDPTPDAWTQYQLPIVRGYEQQLIALVRFAKQEGFGFFQDVGISDVGAWHRLAEHYDVNGLEDTSEIDAIIAVAQEVYKRSLNTLDQVDFDDMILFPLIKNLRVKFGKDYIFVDEAQDLSRVRQALIRKFLNPDGRIIIVGDDRQAIYGFSGADAKALDNMAQSFSAKVFPLSVTWRCPKAVVKVAQRYVPDIEAAPDAPEGEVLHVTELPADLKEGDAILCRNNAPLIETAYALIRKGIPAKVEGREIGGGLLILLNRWKVSTIDALLKKLDDYKVREVQKHLARDQEDRAQAVADKCDTLAEICNAVIKSGKSQVDDVREFITNLFGNSEDGEMKGCVVLASYHKSKGREWPRVILVEHTSRCPSKAARQEWQLQQEANLAYVAVTRAQETLIYLR